MSRVHFSGVALLLAVSTGAWGGGGEYVDAKGFEHASSKTRAQIGVELREAQRIGLMSNIESHYPDVDIADTFAGGSVAADRRTLRVRVRAETLEAGRLGLLSSGDGNALFATAEQEELIAVAGRLAVKDALSSQRVAPGALK
jgi:Domain of unknown function (DUF4148)